jgi:hypothetical protein
MAAPVVYTGKAGCPCGGWGTHVCGTAAIEEIRARPARISPGKRPGDMTGAGRRAAPGAPCPGDEIELVSTTDPHIRLRPGERGTVHSVDGTGTVHARWEGGSMLGLVPGVDAWRIVIRRGAMNRPQVMALHGLYPDQAWDGIEQAVYWAGRVRRGFLGDHVITHTPGIGYLVERRASSVPGGAS